MELHFLRPDACLPFSHIALEKSPAQASRTGCPLGTLNPIFNAQILNKIQGGRYARSRAQWRRIQETAACWNAQAGTVPQRAQSNRRRATGAQWIRLATGGYAAWADEL